MSYTFNTIDGLFQPNYNVYKPDSEIQESKSKVLEPMFVTYKPQNVQRIKSIITEIPTQEDYVDDQATINPNKYEIELQFSDENTQRNYEYFMSELDKFITKHPEYRNIKDSLQYLAELESTYRMRVPNESGSSALGWFQFTDKTRKNYNMQTREQFANDPQAQLMAAAKHYTNLQYQISKRGGDPNDFVTMYGAWWRPDSAYAYLENPQYDFKTQYNESFQKVIQKARNLLSTYGKSNS